MPWLPDPSSYWAQPVTASDVEQSREKYEALRELVETPEDTRRDRLRAISERWPGALRESELVHPEEMARRAAAAMELRPGTPRRGGAGPREAVVLWGTLHLLLADQRALRMGEAGDVRLACVERLVAVDTARARRGDAARRWPDAAQLTAMAGSKVRPRQAYLWLAAQVGLSLPALHQRLFCRAGHWDVRPDDPSWSQPGGARSGGSPSGGLSR